MIATRKLTYSRSTHTRCFQSGSQSQENWSKICSPQSPKWREKRKTSLSCLLVRCSKSHLEGEVIWCTPIDEVESLTSARNSAMSGTDPSDALRVVNALLTQIDRLKYQKNVLIMATSNLAKAIGLFFTSSRIILSYWTIPLRHCVRRPRRYRGIHRCYAHFT